MKNISLTSAMSMNLLSLKQTSSAMSEVQNRLATGLKVNSAIDNPSAYYTAVSLSNRAADLNSLLDNMGQAIQTVKAATEALETGVSFLEQMSSIAEQAVSEPQKNTADGTLPQLTTKNIDDYIAKGYTAITADMTASEINALMTDGAKLVLAEDINLSEPISINADNIILDGNGHKMTSNNSSGAALIVSGFNVSITNIEIDFHPENKYVSAVITVRNGEADISNVRLSNDHAEGYGVVSKYGSVMIDSVAGIQAKHKIVGQVELSALYNGKANTQAIIDQIGAAGLAASAANQFYVGSKTDENFGQGKWYLPAIGELADVYGTNRNVISEEDGTGGATGENKILINAALSTLKGKGAEAETLRPDLFYWSSSEYGRGLSWRVSMYRGKRSIDHIDSLSYVRSFNQVENVNTINGTAPKIGDVMYSDLSYGSADDYDKSKTAVGVVTWVSEDGKSAKIMNLKNLTFNTADTENNFDPDNPYGNSMKTTYWAPVDENGAENIHDIPDFMGGKIIVEDISEPNAGISVSSEWSTAYNGVLNQYDMLINDASYKGINLLKGDALNVIFNENKSSRLNIAGHDISSSALGLSAADWKTIADVSASISDLRRTVSVLRSLSGELGNNYSVVQNRQDFTENLINILTEGADKLTLADMNEESAIMLSLQTRQQLAINSLSLASQASQSVLKLFA